MGQGHAGKRFHIWCAGKSFFKDTPLLLNAAAVCIFYMVNVNLFPSAFL
jgi:hypothetical protein